MRGALALPCLSVLRHPALCHLSGCSWLLPGATDISKMPLTLPSRQSPPAPAPQVGSPKASAN